MIEMKFTEWPHSKEVSPPSSRHVIVSVRCRVAGLSHSLLICSQFLLDFSKSSISPPSLVQYNLGFSLVALPFHSLFPLVML